MNNTAGPSPSGSPALSGASAQPAVFKDFEWAVIRLAIFAESTPPSKSGQRPWPRKPLRLLFSSITLLSQGRQKPAPMDKPKPMPLGDKEGMIHFNRVVMRAADALTWYRSTSHALRVPVPAQSIDENDSIPLAAGNLEDLPAWPILGVPMLSDAMLGTTWSVPPIPYEGVELARYHRRFDGSDEWSVLDPHSLGARLIKSAKAITFLERHVHVNFVEYPEYLGSLNLIVPDGIVQLIDHFVEPTKDGSEKLILRVVPRPGKSLTGLSITTTEANSSMLSSFVTREVPADGVIEIQREQPVESCGLVLTHSELGVLMHQPMRSFMRRMHLGIEVSEPSYEKVAPDTEAKNSPVSRYEVTEMVPASQRTVGPKAVFISAVERVREAQIEREYRKDALRYDQRWLEAGQRKEALAFLRLRIREARMRLIIADPYFGATQVEQLLYAVQRSSVHVTILTSRYAFESQYALKCEEPGQDHANAAGQQKVPNAKRAEFNGKLSKFADLVEIARQRLSNKADVWVAGLGDGDLHDRFLSVDGRVWSLGSSVNMLGERASMILRVPHGGVVLSHLSQLLVHATPLEDYVKIRIGKSTDDEQTNAS